MSEPALGKAVLELSTDDTKLVAGLDGAKSEAAQAAAAIAAMSKALSGSRLEQDARTIVASIQSIGGATRLSDVEAKRYLQTLEQWIQKSERMGTAVPADILKTRDALKQVDAAAKNSTASTLDWKSALTTAAGAFGLALSVGSVVAFGKSVFDSAGKIHDLASQLEISTDRAQGFKFAAEQGGSSIDAVGTALSKMNDNLAGGDKSTVKALKDAGLNFQAIRSMKPEDAFLAITDAIQQIPDPMKQTEVALQLFGKSAGELLPAIKDGFRGVSDGALKMSTDTIDSLAAAGDAWESLGNKVTIVTGTLIAKTMGAASVVTSSWGGLALFAENVVKFGAATAMTMAAAQDEATKAAGKNRDINLSLAPAVHKTAEELAAAAAAAKKYGDAFNAMFGKFSGTSATAEMKMLDAVFRKLASSGQLTEKQITAIVKEALTLTEAGATLTPRLLAVALATDALSPGLNTAKLNLSDLGEQIAIEIPKLDAFSLALQHMAQLPKGNLVPEATPHLGIEIPIPKLEDLIVKTRDAGEALADLSHGFTQLGHDVGGTVGGILTGLGSMTSSLGGALKSMKDFNIASKAGDWTGMATGILGVVSAGVQLGNLFADLTATAKHPGGLLGLRSGWLGDVVGTNTIGRQLIVAFAEAHGGFDKLHADMLAAGDDAERLWKILTQTVDNADPIGAQAAVDAVEAFFASAPSTLAAQAGYHTRAELEETAKKAKDLYNYMLASGQYTAAEIAKAFQASKEAQIAALGDTAAAQDEALDAITAKYTEALGKLESEYKSLSDSVAAEAEEAEMGVIETQQRARMAQIEQEKEALLAQQADEIAAKTETFDAVLDAGQRVDLQLRELFGKPMEIPVIFSTPAGGYAVSSPLPFLPGGTGDSSFVGASSSRATVIENRIILDGREIARNQVRHLPNELALIGVGR